MEIPDIGSIIKKQSKKNGSIIDSKETEKIDLVELNYLPCLIFPKQDLKIRKYNRLVKDTQGLSDDQILEKCQDYFDIVELDETKGVFYICPYN